MIQPSIATLFERIRFSDCVLNDALKVYIYFLIGLYEISLLLGRNYRKHILFVTLTIMLLGNAVLFITIPELDYTFSRIVDFLMSISGIISVIGISKKISSNRYQLRSVLEMIGRNSLPIYLLQGFAIAATSILLTRIGINDSYGILPMVFCTVVGCVLPILAYYISTKIWKLDGVFYPSKYVKL